MYLERSRMEQSEGELIEELKTQNKDAAFKKLMAAHNDFLRRTISTYGVPTHSVDDVLSMVWIKVLKNINKFDTRRAFRPWVTTIAKRLAIDNVRGEIAHRSQLAPSLGNTISFAELSPQEQAGIVQNDNDISLDYLIDVKRKLENLLSDDIEEYGFSEREKMFINVLLKRWNTGEGEIESLEELAKQFDTTVRIIQRIVGSVCKKVEKHQKKRF